MTEQPSSRQQLWIQAYLQAQQIAADSRYTFMIGGKKINGPDQYAMIADEAVEQFDQRFQATSPGSSPIPADTPHECESPF